MEKKSSCCPPNSEPFLKNTFPQSGIISKIGNLDVYRVGDGPKTIIVANDIYGFNGGRVRAICDELAKEGYSVVLPDLLNGDKWHDDKPVDGLAIEWALTKPCEPIVDYINNILIPELEKEGKKEFASIGFCWGVWIIWRTLAADQNHKIKAAIGMHPSLGVEDFFKGDIKAITEKIHSAIFLAPAGNDPIDIKEGGEIINILRKNNPEKVLTVDFPDMQHGWVVRGDLAISEVQRDYEKAMNLAKEFLKKNF